MSMLERGETKWSHEGQERVVLNVGGKRFITYKETLQRFPDTLLGRMFSSSSLMAHPDCKGEYFFDRNARFFAPILNWYRTGVFPPPKDIPFKTLHGELCFWGVDDSAVEGIPWKFFLLKKACKDHASDSGIESYVKYMIPVLLNAVNEKKQKQRFFVVTEAQTSFQLSQAETQEAVGMIRHDGHFSRLNSAENQTQLRALLARINLSSTVEKFETKFTSGPRNGEPTGESYFEIKVELQKIKLQVLSLSSYPLL